MAENDLAPSHGQVIELTQDLQADFQDSQVMQDNSMTVLFKESHLGILVLTIKRLTDQHFTLSYLLISTQVVVTIVLGKRKLELRKLKRLDARTSK